MNQSHDRLKESVIRILSCDGDFYQMKQSVDCMYSIYRSISEVNADDQNDAHIIVPSGKAISPSMAAHCLLEMKRTALFLRGIHETIECKIKERKNLPIYILYAGTGPYATLVTPLLLLFKPSEIKVDLLDINPVSLNSAVKILNELGLGQFIGSVYLADAAVFQAEKNYDVVISETMQAALKKEPQVAIMQNLIPQCAANTIFIPQEITVHAEIISKGKWNNTTCLVEGVRRIELGEVIKVNKENLNSNDFKTVFPITKNRGGYNTLMLTTSITVYGNHQLNNSDCSLTLPLRIHDMTDNESEFVRFWYEQGKVPGIRFQFPDSNEIHSAIGRKEYQPTILTE